MYDRVSCLLVALSVSNNNESMRIKRKKKVCIDFDATLESVKLGYISDRARLAVQRKCHAFIKLNSSRIIFVLMIL